MTTDNLAIVIPVFKDWTAFSLLVRGIDEALTGKLDRVRIIAVNDASPSVEIDATSFQDLRVIRGIDTLHLARNLGHQRAIVIGLCHVHHHVTCEQVVVMDADGEDDPKAIPRLIEACTARPGEIVVASRGRRSESFLFVSFYWLYRRIFRVLTGKQISFGNFSLMPASLLNRLVRTPEIWSHYAAGILRSGIPFSSITVDRSTRLAGQTRMNFTSLIGHGLSAVSVFADSMAVRLTMLTISLILLTIMGLTGVLGIRFLTDLAIPGWATNVTIGLGLIFFQAFSLSVVFVFLVLLYRTQQGFFPIRDYEDHVLSVEQIKIGE